MPRIAMLGTGTNVGKSYVTRALAAELARCDPGSAVAAVKPIESGYDSAGETDARQLETVSVGVPLPSPHPLYALRDPVSPHLAARREGRRIDLDAVATWLAQWERRAISELNKSGPRRLWTLIETAGALFSPVCPPECNFELASRIRADWWVLIATDSLGVLHDVRLTWEACVSRGRTPDFLVLTTARGVDASTGTNADELAALGLPRAISVLSPNSTDLSSLAAALIRSADARAARS